ncbi:MAG: hypothetical protein UX07_C0044G0002 [Parcubacteria group bacterium GW2011_GWA2_45_30]|nr:MAG: hypothetical protein UX07_C0044G0002 [Parcubacteria group bacterium GW2011_GWA2_45_30]
MFDFFMHIMIIISLVFLGVSVWVIIYLKSKEQRGQYGLE